MYHTNWYYDKPVGFTARLHPRFGSAEWRGRNISGSAHLLSTTHCTLPVLPLHSTIGGRLPEWQTSKNASPPWVLFGSSHFFTIHRRHRRKKWWTRILKFEFVIFENFLKFWKRRCAVPLRPIWTIMVTAKLDQSRVPVTKFRQNRLTLKGRSAGQRQTHRQTSRLVFGWISPNKCFHQH